MAASCDDITDWGYPDNLLQHWRRTRGAMVQTQEAGSLTMGLDTATMP